MKRRQTSCAKIGLAIAAAWATAAQEKGIPPVHYSARHCVNMALQEERTVLLGARILPASRITLTSCVLFLTLFGMLIATFHPPVLWRLHRTVKTHAVALHKTIFSDKVAWRHHYLPAELWLVAMLMMNGLLELCRFPNSKRARMARACMEPKERAFFARPRARGRLTRLWYLALFLSRQVYGLQSELLGGDPELREDGAL